VIAFLVQLAISNLLLSAILAGVAYAVHRRGRYPALAHLLWVLVLAKLVTPPLFSLPLAQIPGSSGASSGPALASAVSAGPGPGAAWLVERGVTVLLLAWALGSAVVLVVSLLRIYRFDRLLRRTSSQAPAGMQWLAREVAEQLELRSPPTIYISTARLSPMTWWAGGRVRVVLPKALPDEVDSEQLRWVIAHELAHVKRRDHLVRWLEWIACVSFWWNPVAWWARSNLRFDEEASCDALVLDRLGPQPRSYAMALLTVVELMSGPAMRPPAVATGIDGGGPLEQRFRMIISGRQPKRLPRWLLSAVVVATLVMMPLGVGQASDEAGASAAPAAASLGLADSQVVEFSPAEQAFVSPASPNGAVPAVTEEAGDAARALLSARVTPAKTAKAEATKKAKKGKKGKKAAARAARAREAKKADGSSASSTGWIDTATIIIPSGPQLTSISGGPPGRPRS
jgi:beta-lactamase regulating signal transducer with metallopeptidase domain